MAEYDEFCRALAQRPIRTVELWNDYNDPDFEAKMEEPAYRWWIETLVDPPN